MIASQITQADPHMRQPANPIQLLFFIGALLVLFVVMQIQLVKVAADKLGLSGSGMVMLLFVSLLGSTINMPLFKVRSAFDPANLPDFLQQLIDPGQFVAGQTQIAINVGGAVIPIGFSAFLILQQQLPVLPVLLAIVIISAISYGFSRPMANIGITMPLFVAPIAAALIAILLVTAEHRAAVAYISGTLGVLIGADLLRLRDIRQLAVPQASIGGAGTFDGIFITGLVAVLLT